MLNWDPGGRPRKPTLIGIGAQKAGTTWLSQMLGQHPHVWAPEHRDWLPWHFRRAKLNIAKRYEKRGEIMPPILNAYLDRITRGEMFTNHWYKQVFAPAPPGTQPLDVTPEYSTLPTEGLDFIARFLPDAKFVYLIRHPVDRAISQLKMNLTRAGRKPQTMEDWLAEAQDPVLLDRGDYETYVPPWNDRFGADRLMYLPFGRIAADPLRVMRQVESFFGLPPHEYRGLDAKVFAATSALSVPDPVRAALRAKMEHQFTFLDAQFGPEFTAQIR